ncbi:maleylpyruvate isomerase family mycothiol-dependent enzyme [Nonomuraea dietziae]|uniref:maleylpyruvate isomerase family mycothiol-dependent enzyme n=1 Tax=Nonomuraea dietziae TaxID=65515 RepID=UPI0031D096EB
MKQLEDFDPFDLFDTEAARLDRHFASLDEEGWHRPSRCDGWSVRDVLGHLAGEELYNHACLDGDVQGFFAMVEAEGVTGFDGFNEWCVRQRRALPVEQVLEEWRTKNGQTRERMRALGREGTLQTSAGPYPAGLQTFHYASEYATHADDVGARRRGRRAGRPHLVAADAGQARAGRAGVQGAGGADGRTGLGPRRRGEQVDVLPRVRRRDGRRTLPEHELDPRLATALRCLA